MVETNSKTVTVAFATDDGKQFMERHFGDALFYDIYTINDSAITFLKRINNSTEEEEGHADPKKAKGVSSLFQKDGIRVVVSRIFGPNLKRMNQKFLCIVVSSGDISFACNYIQKNSQTIFESETNVVKISR